MEKFNVFQACKTCAKKRQAEGLPDDEFWLKEHIKWVAKEQGVRNNEILEDIRRHHMKEERPKLFSVDMCWPCYAFLHGTSRSSLDGLRKRAAETPESVEDKEWSHQGKNQAFHSAPVREAVLKFIENLVETLGESDPTHKAFIQLPADTKANHFADFVYTMSQQEGPICSYGYFCSMWSKHFPHVILPSSTRWVSRIFSLRYLLCYRSSAKFVVSTRIKRGLVPV